MSRWKLAAEELEWRHEQMMDCVCGVDGCSFGGFMKLRDWIPIRDEHRRKHHPSWKEPKRRSRRAAAA